ncbi:hypothetical protein NMG60_11026901 [Bertholletia excelsa]
MTNTMETPATVEWRKRGPDGSSENLHIEPRIMDRLCSKAWNFLKKAWDLAADDPRKVVHSLKVGIALTVVSIIYYMRPLYEGVGGNAMWAIMTVVVIFEYTVGATICKCLNRALGTFLAGLLALGVQWVASQSGERFEPIIVGASVFLLASAATFSRFVPVIKARFDYGAMIFILTFSLVSVSGYRVEKLFDLAHQRLSTIIIGISICIIVSTLVCPIWAGQELHCLVTRNMEKLANSLDCCVCQYFNGEGTNNGDKEYQKKLEGYKCVLGSKATEESMAGFARWEPAYGCFSFKHPWKQYLKIGASMRSCAYCIEALNSFLTSESQAPELIKRQLRGSCLRVSTNSSRVIRDLAIILKTLRKSTKLDILVEEMNSSVEELQNDLKALPSKLIQVESDKAEPILPTITIVRLVDVIPPATFASLLIEIVARIGGIVDEVEELEALAEFRQEVEHKPTQNQDVNKDLSDQWTDEVAMKVLQKV